MADTVKAYDVVIVGSGFAGATLAKKLGEAGKQVLILEAGPPVPHSREDYMENFFLTTFKSPESPYPPNHLARDPSHTNVPRPSIPDLVLGWKPKGTSFAETDPNEHEHKSYLISKVDKNRELTPFASTYERIAGGTGNHWMGTCLRMTENDFKVFTKYKRGKDWPIGYNDLEPHYKSVEKLIGVSGDKHDQEMLQTGTNSNNMSFDYPMPGIPKSYLDTVVAEALTKNAANGSKLQLGKHTAIVTSTPAGRNSAPYQNRRVCHGNTNCTPICPIQAKYDPTVALSQALETGNVDIRYQHVVDFVAFYRNEPESIVVDLHVVKYKDISAPVRDETQNKKDMAKEFLSALQASDPTIKPIDKDTTFVLAANAIENAKIMLNSFKQISSDPGSLSKSDSLLGKHLMDHPVYLAWGLLGRDQRAYGYRGPLSTSGIETGRDGDFRADRAAWRIEIGNEGWNWPAEDPYSTACDFIYGTNSNKLNDKKEILYGNAYVIRLNEILTRQFRVGFLVEQDASPDSYIQLSAEEDGLGIPRVEVVYHISEYVREGFKSARKAAEDLFNQLGVSHEERFAADSADDVLQFMYKGESYHYQGAGHVCGTHIMGDSAHPDLSVVDEFQKCHSHQNLYLVGCGSMPSIGTQNPTLTMLAMTDRTADAILKLA